MGSNHQMLILGLLLLGLTTEALPRTGIHCAQPPKITLRMPNDTMSIETVCMFGFDRCAIDTFYRSELSRVMVKDFKTMRHCAIGYIDSVYRHLILDSSYNSDSTLYVDTLQGEKVWASLVGNLKSPIPETHLVFNETLTYWPPNQSQVSYKALIDTPFIAFFNTYQHLNEMGIGPEDGCFYEPFVFFLINGELVARGDIRRRPGISLPFDLFLTEVAVASIPGIVKIDTTTKILPFRFGKTKLRRMSPDGWRGHGLHKTKNQ